MRRILLGAAAAAVLAAFAWILPTGVNAQSTEVVVPFKVFTTDPKTPVYVGEYTVATNGSVITEKQRYRKPSGEVVIERESVFDLGKRRPVSFSDRNQLLGKVWKAKVDGSKISVRIEDLKGNVDTDKTVSLPAETFIWPNFFYTLPQDWDKLNKSDDYEARIFVLSRQDDYGMRVKSEGAVTVAGVPGKRFRVESSSAFGRAIAPATRLTLAQDPPHRVIQYEGNGAVQDSHGDKLDATIVFEWPKG